MREIKFRGKRVDSGEWIYGYFIPTFDNAPGIGVKSGYVYEVIPETVTQFVGRKVNEVGLYVGDVVEVKGMKKAGTYKTVIVESDQGFTLAENKTYLNNDRCFFCITKILGTIYDNTELL